mgnify:CR=1 FL=1
MVPSPPLWAVLGDVLLCLGAGLLLGAVRDGATLAFGSGPVRCFVWDVLAFAAAAFVCCGFAAGASATGALVYGRRHGAGGTVLAVVRFPRGAQGAARHGVCSGLAAALCGGLCGTPVQTAAAGPDQKDSARPAAQRTRFMQEKRKKAEKCVAKQAHNII